MCVANTFEAISESHQNWENYGATVLGFIGIGMHLKDFRIVEFTWRASPLAVYAGHDDTVVARVSALKNFPTAGGRVMKVHVEGCL